MPPRVDYALTDLGRSLLDAVISLVVWSENHIDQIYAARAAHDDAHAKQAAAFD